MTDKETSEIARQLGSLGGLATARKMTPEQLKERSRLGVEARRKKREAAHLKPKEIGNVHVPVGSGGRSHAHIITGLDAKGLPIDGPCDYCDDALARYDKQVGDSKPKL